MTNTHMEAFSTGISSTKELQERFRDLANNAGLTVECGSHGTYQAQLAIIAEAPGRTEVAQGIPLVGGSGHILWKAIRTYVPSVKRHDCYVTNVCKRQVSFGVDEQRKPIGKHELTTWQELLKWELSMLPNLKYVLLLGGYALDALTPHTGITNWRGSILPVTIGEGERTVLAVVTFNPAYGAREPIQNVIFDMDIGDKLKRVIDGTYRQHSVHTHINPSAHDAIAYIRRMGNSRLPIATDIEVISNETACVGLSNDPHEAMCIAFRDELRNIYTESDEADILNELYTLYNLPHIRLVLQNGGFDLGWLWFKDKIRTRPAHFDTMLAHHCLYPQLPHDLGFIVKQYTLHPYYKNEKDEWRTSGDINTFWEYNGRDCALTLASVLPMQAELREAGLLRFYREHVQRLQHHLVRMTVGGVKVDTLLKDDITSTLERDLETKLRTFYRAVQHATGDQYYVPNPRSPKQMSELWFSKLKLVGRGVSTDATNRELMHKHPRTSHEAKQCIIALDDYIRDDKFFSTYATAQADYDGRMRCDYSQIGVRAAPGRLSSRATLWGSGMNLQNIPERAKEMFVADSGFCFIYIDGSQAEARVVGWNYNIRTWIDQFERARRDGSYDAHRALAADMFGIPYDEVPTFDRYPLSAADAEIMGVPFIPDRAGQVTIRYTAKRCRHGLNYRMGPDRLSLTTGLSASASSDAYVRYHKLTPEVKIGWERDLADVRKNKVLFNALGRRFIMLEPPTLENTDSIVAFYPQSTIGDMVCRVIYKCHDDPLWPTDARIVLNTHDGLVALAKIGESAKRALRIMIKHAEAPLFIRGRELIIPAEPAMSVPDVHGIHRWSTIKKMKRKEIV